MLTARAKLAAELVVPGVNIQVLDYRWSAGEKIHEVSNDDVLSFRAFPRQVTVSAITERNKLDFGKLFFIPSGVPVATNAAECEELVRTIRCRFEPSWLAKIWQSTCIDWNDRELGRSYDMHSIRIEEAVRRLGMEAVNPGFASALMVDSLSNVIAIEVARYFQRPSEPSRIRIRGGKMSESNLQRIREYVHSLENSSPSIEDIAGVCGISAAHMRRSFKNATGTTVHDYVEEVRLNKTKSLLVETDLPLKEVAFRVGFANLSTLSSSFKRLSGVSPSEFRSMNRH